MYYILNYDYVEDYLERRKPYREAHLDLAQSMLASGELVMAGTFNLPLHGAEILFKSGKDKVEEFIDKDPYVKNGIVMNWKIKEWNVVVGG